MKPFPSDFWNALAPYHASIENSYLDLPALHRFLHQIHDPVLVVGAGQGLIVAELQKQGLECAGIDFSAEMVRYAKTRRGLNLIHADAKAMPFAPGSYRTIIVATGVVDFISDQEEIRSIMHEARRVLEPSGTIYVAFYRLSPATEEFMVRLGLLKNHLLLHREALSIHQLNFHRAIAWVGQRANLSYWHSLLLSLRAWAFSTWQEKRNAFHMRKILAHKNPDEFMRTLPEAQPYRDATEIKNLFVRLTIPIKQIRAFGNCFIVEI